MTGKTPLSKTQNPANLVSRPSWNAVVDRLRQANNQRPISSAPSISTVPSVILVKNLTGSALQKGHPFRIGRSLPPFSGSNLNDYAFSRTHRAEVSDETSVELGFALEYIPDDETGAAWTCGTGFAQIDVLDTNHHYARPIAGNRLESCAGKTHIKIVEQISSYTGDFKKIMYPVPLDFTFGTTAAEVERGNTVDININKGEPFGQTQEATFDRLSQEKISAGKEVAIKYIPDEGIFLILHAECEDSQEGFGQANMSTATAGADIGAGWNDLDYFDEISVPGRGVTFDTNTGYFALNRAGVWQIQFSNNFAHNNLNSGRKTNIRIVASTDDVVIGQPAPIGISRNVENTQFSFAFFMNLPKEYVDVPLKFQIGGGDSITSVVYNSLILNPFIISLDE